MGGSCALPGGTLFFLYSHYPWKVHNRYLLTAEVPSDPFLFLRCSLSTQDTPVGFKKSLPNLCLPSRETIKKKAEKKGGWTSSTQKHGVLGDFTLKSVSLGRRAEQQTARASEELQRGSGHQLKGCYILEGDRECLSSGHHHRNATDWVTYTAETYSSLFWSLRSLRSKC